MKKAIVVSGCRKLVGEIFESVSPGENITVINAVEFRLDGFLVPTPDGRGMAIQYFPKLVPLDLEEKPIDIWVKVDNIRLFDDMEDKGRRYETMLSEFEQMLIQARAAKAGIISANTVPKQTPKIKL